MRSTQKTEGEKITTTSEMTLKIKRGPINIDLVMSSEFVETADGKPLSMRSVQKMGATPITTNYVFGPEGVVATTEQGGRTSTATRPLPKGSWMTPAAGTRFTSEQLKSGIKKIEVTTIDPSSGPEPMTMVRHVGEIETITVNGKPVSATKTTVDMSSMPGVPSVEYVDEQGLPLRSETSMGGLQLTMVAAGPEAASAAVGETPEMMASTLIKPSRAIKSARTCQQAVYEVKTPEGKIPELPVGGYQTVVAIDEHTARVIVDLEAPGIADKKDATNAEFTGASALIDPTDEQIKKLVTRATAKLRAGVKEHEGDAGGGGVATAVEVAARVRAEAIRKAVYRHLKKTLGVGFASASEAVRSREGDCTEHGVLLAAALRADGIPARVVAGVVYVDEFVGSSAVFGYHMWAQALIEVDGKPRWIDLDATLSEKEAFDATHIAMVVSSLADDQPQNSLVGLASTLGTLKIKVESTR